MKIAVAIFGNRVSPRFDCAGAFIITVMNPDETTGSTRISAEGLSPYDRIRLLGDLGVKVLICGAIDNASAHQLIQKGIALYSWISGTVEDSLQGLHRGELEPGMMMGSGGRCRGRWRMRCGHGEHRQRFGRRENGEQREGGYENAKRRQNRPRR